MTHGAGLRGTNEVTERVSDEGGCGVNGRGGLGIKGGPECGKGRCGRQPGAAGAVC